MEDIILERRSIYPPQFTGEEIPRSVIERMLNAARFAPNHRLTQPWRFVVYSGSGRAQFAQTWIAANQNHAGDSFDPVKAETFRSKVMMCSHIITIGMKRNPIVPEFEEVCAVASAVQNMMLVAHEQGAGGYWSTGGLVFYDSLKAEFGLEQHDQLLGFLMLGMPKNIEWPPRLRHDLDHFVRWVD